MLYNFVRRQLLAWHTCYETSSMGNKSTLLGADCEVMGDVSPAPAGQGSVLALHPALAQCLPHEAWLIAPVAQQRLDQH